MKRTRTRERNQMTDTKEEEGVSSQSGDVIKMCIFFDLFGGRKRRKRILNQYCDDGKVQ